MSKYAATVGADAGHGLPYDSGTAWNGFKEATIVQPYIDKFAWYCLTYWNVQVLKTRNSNEYKAATSKRGRLSARSKACNRWGVDYALSIHVNGSENQQANGTETFAYKYSTTGKWAAAGINKAAITGFKEAGYKMTDRGVKTNSLSFTGRRTNATANLLELGFIRNKHDLKAMMDPKSWDRVAFHLAQHVCEEILDVPQTKPFSKKKGVAPKAPLYNLVVGGFRGESERAVAERVLKAQGWYYKVETVKED